MKKVLIILGILVIFIGAGYFVWQKVKLKTNLSQPSTLPEITKEEQPVSKHPWSQFHGSYFHTGYAGNTEIAWKHRKDRSFLI